jgi:mannose-6-phosphate isomerase-like protein (cupin superfamily)
MLNYTTECSYCSKNFEITNLNQLYCSIDCEKKSGFTKCVVCKVEFENPNNKILCDNESCLKKYISDHPIKAEYNNSPRNCLFCNKQFLGERDYCSLACAHQLIPIFSQIACSNDIFDVLLQNILNSRSKIVSKPWGGEVHIINHNEYCLKYLIFFKTKQFSHHTHNLKKELWHVITGAFEGVLETAGVKKHLLLETGSKLEIEPGLIHQLQALENSIIVEVSTRDFPEDSIRLISGIN